MFVSPAIAAVNIDFVSIGDAGNANDAATGNAYGGVAYDYQISKNETTISQYAEFLNAAAQTDSYGLYNSNMGTDGNVAGITRSGVSGSYSYSVLTGAGNRPIAYVSWFDAARYCNWLQNGQGSGSTETGAYTLAGAMSGVILKNGGATYYIPTESEWYKAAYYDPNKGGAGVGGYWAQATRSDTLAGNTIGVADSGNFNDGDYAKDQNGLPSYLTDAGAYGVNSQSAYGTNDQAGNVYEWNDAVISGSLRGLRGGSCFSSSNFLPASGRGNSGPSREGANVGFRVASVPEPTSHVLTMLAGGVMFARRKR